MAKSMALLASGRHIPYGSTFCLLPVGTCGCQTPGLPCIRLYEAGIDDGWPPRKTFRPTMMASSDVDVRTDGTCLFFHRWSEWSILMFYLSFWTPYFSFFEHKLLKQSEQCRLVAAGTHSDCFHTVRTHSSLGHNISRSYLTATWRFGWIPVLKKRRTKSPCWRHWRSLWVKAEEEGHISRIELFRREMGGR